jgi:hypothetical protein
LCLHLLAFAVAASLLAAGSDRAFAGRVFAVSLAAAALAADFPSVALGVEPDAADGESLLRFG